MAFDIDMIRNVYNSIPKKVDKARAFLGRPMTLTEKILYSHLWNGETDKEFVRGKDYVLRRSR